MYLGKSVFRGANTCMYLGKSSFGRQIPICSWANRVFDGQYIHVFGQIGFQGSQYIYVFGQIRFLMANTGMYLVKSGFRGAGTYIYLQDSYLIL